MKKVAVTVEFITDLPAEIDPETIYTSIRDVGEVVRFEALVDGHPRLVARARDYETISAAVLEDVYLDEGRE